MGAVRLTACAVVGGVAGYLTMSPSATASERAFTYAVMHPFYGDIGTLTEVVDRQSDTTRIDSHLSVAVKLLGIVAYREDNDAVEVMRDDRLISLQCRDTKNGASSEVQGQAEGDHFVVNTPAGIFTAPASVEPSDPWLIKGVGDGVMVSTKSGKILNAHIMGGEEMSVTVQGARVSVRHYTIYTDKLQEVWVDRRDVPVMFRTLVNGDQIDFVLQTPLPTDELADASSPPLAVPPLAIPLAAAAPATTSPDSEPPPDTGK